MNNRRPRDPGALLREIDQQPLPQEINQRLLRARNQAVLSTRERRQKMLWAPVATFANASGLALVMSLPGDRVGSPPDLSADPIAAEFVYGEDDVDMLEDLEFYHWLERQGYAG